MKWFIKYSPIILLHIVVVLIIIANFPVGKFFIGWDALNPEFNFPLNFSRSIFASWQEHYGAGALTGHGYAATLPHILTTYFLSFFIPLISIRPAFTFLCFYLGVLGMYFLIKHVLQDIKQEKTSEILIPTLACFSALLYGLHLGTLQIFYIQLEAFIGQFASLPWLFLYALLLLKKPSTKLWTLFFIINFVASLQGFIPSLFVVYAVSLAVVLLIHVLQNKTKKALFQALSIGVVTFIANSYWFLPFFYFQITKGSDFLEAYNNLTSTPRFIELSTKYGSFGSVGLLKSYLFDSFELGSYILSPWINHYKQIPVALIGYSYFALAFMGVIFAFASRKKHLTSFGLIFLYLFASTAINTPPFSFVNFALIKLSPTYEQAFRTTFTKFGIELTFFYALMAGVALLFLYEKLHRSIQSLNKSFVFAFLCIALFSTLIYYALPTFTGSMLYRKLEITIPSAYFDLSNYLNSQGDGRIADLPQNCPDGWYAYKWGYFGSGFLWYSIKQPIMARSFDVWSNNNENYYRELTFALASEDYKKASLVLNKYDATWVVYDPNSISCSDQKSIKTNKNFISFLSTTGFRQEKVFTAGTSNPITLFKRKAATSSSYINSSPGLLTIGPATNWLDYDSVYENYNDYGTRSESNDVFYPFRSLLTSRTLKDQDFSISQNEKTITFSSKIPQGIQDYIVKWDGYNQLGAEIPVKLSLVDAPQEKKNILLTLLFPKLSIDQRSLGENEPNILLTQLPVLEGSVRIVINGQETKPTSENSFESILSMNEKNTIEVFLNEKRVFLWNSESDASYQEAIKTGFEYRLPIYRNGIFSITVPKVIDQHFFGNNSIKITKIPPIPCNEVSPTNRNSYEIEDSQTPYVRMISQNSTQCLNFTFDGILTQFGHLFTIDTKNISGNLPKTSIFNKNNLVYTDIATGLAGKKTSSYYIIPPTSRSEFTYDIQVENSSRSLQKSVNDIYSAAIYQIPYPFLKDIRFLRKTDYKTQKSGATFLPNSISHNSSVYYDIQPTNKTSAQILTMSQSFDKGWVAYTINSSGNDSPLFGKIFPFLSGKRLHDHILINNWKNGWTVPPLLSNEKVIIVYLPQYLEYAGFGLMGINVLVLVGMFVKSYFKRN